MSTDLSQKIPQYFCCNICDYNTCYYKDFQKHLQTKKHLRNALSTPSNQKSYEKVYKCENCNKVYNDRSGLWRHKINKNGNCNYNLEENKNNEMNNNPSDKELIMMLIKENAELKKHDDGRHIIILWGI